MSKKEKRVGGGVLWDGECGEFMVGLIAMGKDHGDEVAPGLGRRRNFRAVQCQRASAVVVKTRLPAVGDDAGNLMKVAIETEVRGGV